ncbi:hypothetical protein X737_22190 [Mesorhizobium sp. L48C026A00]|nr:hypothetical protein X737_22190 [Mesorhizobium sp. L48C026A00]
MNALTPAVSTGSPPASRKIHKPGTIHPHIKVPMREISVHPTAGEPPVTVYDPSGPYTDPTVETSIDKASPDFATNGLRRAAISRPMKAAMSGRNTMDSWRASA